VPTTTLFRGLVYKWPEVRRHRLLTLAAEMTSRDAVEIGPCIRYDCVLEGVECVADSLNVLLARVTRH